MKPSFQLEQADALSRYVSMDDNSVDVIFSDPPYSSLEKHRKVGTTTRLKVSEGSSNQWFPVIENEVLLQHVKEWQRILKPGRHLYMMCDPETACDVVPAIKQLGWKYGNILVWKKSWIGLGYHYRRSYENILFFTKKESGSHKKRKLRNLGMADVLDKPEYRALRGPDYYPTEKPVSLIVDVLHQSTEPGELVLDPFCGSGSTGEAALTLGCRFVGFDVQADAIQRSTTRLESFLTAEQRQPSLPGVLTRPEAILSAPEPPLVLDPPTKKLFSYKGTADD